jgi:hypothetical protein
MGQKELLRGKVMELVKWGHLTIAVAAREMKASYRFVEIHTPKKGWPDSCAT